jgi:hypothetical protein
MADTINNPPQSNAPPFERGLWQRSWFILLLCFIAVEVDWELVPLSVFPFLYIFPVMLAAWNHGLLFPMLCVTGLSLVRVAHQFVFDARPDSIDEGTTALVRFFVLTLLTALTYMLGRQSRQLRQRVRMLEGILPICSQCKSIRDEQNNWVQLEGYITTHSAAQFSHSLCPHCFKEFYGEEAASRVAAK